DIASAVMSRYFASHGPRWPTCRSSTPPRAPRSGCETASTRSSSSLDVVHRHARLARLALDQVGDRCALEHRAGGGGSLTQHAFRVAAQGSVEQLDDLECRYVGGLAGEAIAALDATLAGQDPSPAQCREQLLEE